MTAVADHLAERTVKPWRVLCSLRRGGLAPNRST